jgi:hypothetical protein
MQILIHVQALISINTHMHILSTAYPYEHL